MSLLQNRDGVLETRVCLALDGQLPMVSVEDSIEALLGFTADDYRSGRVSLRQQIHPHDNDIADTLFSSDDPAATGTFNIRLRHADGRIRCIYGQYRKELGANGLALHLLLQDPKTLQRTMSDVSTVANFTAMMENTDDYIYSKDRNHVLTGASQTLVSICDAPAEHWTDLLGQTDYDVFPEELADIYYRLEKQIFAGVPVPREVQQTQTKDGKKGWVDNRKYPIRNEHGEIIGLFGIARDITENKQAEQALQESEERYRSLVEMTFDWVWEVDTQGRYTYASPRISTILGYQPGEVLGRTPFDLMPADEAQRVKVFFEGLMAARQTFSVVDNVNLHRDGGLVFLETSGAPILSPEGTLLGYRGVDRDITQRKNSELQLVRDNLLLKTQQEVSPDGILIVDENDNIISFNQKFCKIWDIPDHIMAEQSSEKAMQYVLPLLINPDEFVKRIRDLFQDKKAHSFEEITLKNGKVLARHSSPMFGSDAQYYGRVWFFRDITKRKQAEVKLRAKVDALRASYAELEQFNRAMVDRELRMIELKQEINDLCRRLGEPPRHATGQFQTGHIPGAGPALPGEGDA